MRMIVITRLFPLNLTGFSINRYVSQASKTDKIMAPIRAAMLTYPSSIMFINVIMGQCHKYSGKLIRPNQTRNLQDKIFRLTHAAGPAQIINTAPRTGITAHLPGKLRLRLIRQKPYIRNKTPKIEITFINIVLSF